MCIAAPDTVAPGTPSEAPRSTYIPRAKLSRPTTWTIQNIAASSFLVTGAPRSVAQRPPFDTFDPREEGLRRAPHNTLGTHISTAAIRNESPAPQSDGPPPPAFAFRSTRRQPWTKAKTASA